MKIAMTTETLMLFSLLILFQTSQAYLLHRHDCPPSSCGTIHNISFPFRLNHDPKKCGDPNYELSCENNVTTLILGSQKYLVKAINYDNDTIRVADISIAKNICSFPQFPLYGINFTNGFPFSNSQPFFFGEVPNQVALPLNFMNCPFSLKNSSLFTELATECSSNGGRFGYVKVGHMNPLDVPYMCSVDLIVLTSWKFRSLLNVSVSEIHESLVYGFELSWSPFKCIECKDGRVCTVVEDPLECSEGFRIQFHMNWGDVLILVLIVVVPGCLGVSIIIGLAYLWILFITSNKEWFFSSVEGTVLNVLFISGISLAVRFIILFPCFIGLLIYKFRRRKLSVFDAIEHYLQSDNELMPIRYSYSDIKKITRGLRETLGQGGYGTVYKGRLRSGHDVAVKLLGKSGASGKDFINEIATIGRIHHVNVVKLVGYCAEGSKRALVLDFMPNGSLDKYLYNQEKMNSLTWEKKYDIAVGIARGIEYLHRGCDIQILHFDIKPQNILLDDKLTPKITDFGLAKSCSTEKNMVTLTAARGTIGYVAPELINRCIGIVSYKADVYSFGMLLIEMVGLKRDLRGNDQTSSRYFPCWIYDYFEHDKDIGIEIAAYEDENNDENMDGNSKIAKKMTIVALWCIQMRPDDRPSMSKVVEMLESQVERLRVPNRPSLSTSVNDAGQSWTTYSYSTDSTSLLSRDAAPSVEITIED